MGLVIIGIIVGVGLVAICGGIENIERKKRVNMTYKDFKKLKQQGRL